MYVLTYNRLHFNHAALERMCPFCLKVCTHDFYKMTAVSTIGIDNREYNMSVFPAAESAGSNVIEHVNTFLSLESTRLIGLVSCFLTAVDN